MLGIKSNIRHMSPRYVCHMLIFTKTHVGLSFIRNGHVSLLIMLAKAWGPLTVYAIMIPAPDIPVPLIQLAPDL